MAKFCEARRQIHNASLHVRTDIKSDRPATNLAIAARMQADKHKKEGKQTPETRKFRHSALSRAMLSSYLASRDELLKEHRFNVPSKPEPGFCIKKSNSS